MTAQRRQDDTLREAVERLLEKWEAKSNEPTFDEFDRLVCDTYESRASDLRAVLAAHPAPSPDADLCGLCKQPATGLASIDTTRYCHGDEDASPTCYEVACWRETGRVSSPMDMDTRPGLCACGRPGCSDGSDTLVAASSLQPMPDPYKSGGMVDTMTDPYRGSNANERCHCGMPVVYGYDGDPTNHRGMCEHCDSVRCDAYPGECGRLGVLVTSVPAGSDTADEPRVCGERYGVQPDICRKPEGHEGWHDDGTGQWPVEPAPSLTPEPVACVWDVATGYQCPRCQLYVAVVKRDSPVYCPRGCVQEPAPPEDEREALAAAIYAGGDEPEWITTADGSPNAGSYEHADRVIAAGWRSPTEVAALVTDAERRTREQVAGEIAEAFWESFTPDMGGVDWPDDEAIQRFARKVAPLINLATRAAAKAVGTDG